MRCGPVSPTRPKVKLSSDSIVAVLKRHYSSTGVNECLAPVNREEESKSPSVTIDLAKVPLDIQAILNELRSRRGKSCEASTHQDIHDEQMIMREPIKDSSNDP